MDTVKLQAEPRSILGKHVKTLRRQGLVPANLYGHRVESLPLQLPEKQVELQLLRASRAALFALQVDGGEPRTVLVKQIQRHPTTGRVLHVDFYQVAMTEKLRAAVPLQFVGEAPAVKVTGGTLLRNLTTVEVESLPADLPAGIPVDVSTLETLEDAVYVRDLQLPPGVDVLTDGDEIVAKVSPPTVEEEVEGVPATAEAPAEAPAQAEAAAEE